MIKKEKIEELIAEPLSTSPGVFVVSLEITTSNKIILEIDSMTGISVGDCVKFSRAIEFNLDREQEDFELEVASAGANAPFKVKEQYIKNIGRDVEVTLKDGQVIKGKLMAANAEMFTIEAELLQKTEDSKKKKKIIEQKSLIYSEINKVKVILKF